MKCWNSLKSFEVYTLEIRQHLLFVFPAMIGYRTLFQKKKVNYEIFSKTSSKIKYFSVFSFFYSYFLCRRFVQTWIYQSRKWSPLDWMAQCVRFLDTNNIGADVRWIFRNWRIILNVQSNNFTSFRWYALSYQNQNHYNWSQSNIIWPTMYTYSTVHTIVTIA